MLASSQPAAPSVLPSDCSCGEHVVIAPGAKRGAGCTFGGHGPLLTGVSQRTRVVRALPAKEVLA